MSGYRLASAARADLSEIIDFIAADSPAAADRVLDAIYDAILLLAERPDIGHMRLDLTDLEVRFWPVMGRYSIVYRRQDSRIEIVRVFGPGQDIAAGLG